MSDETTEAPGGGWRAFASVLIFILTFFVGLIFVSQATD